MPYENIFYRSVGSTVTGGISARRRQSLPEAMASTAEVEIYDGTGAQLLPITTPDYSNGPAPILKDVKITLDGDYMSLKRAEFSISIIKNEAAFFDIDEKILYPGAPISIKYKSTQRAGASDAGDFNGLVYDYSFTVKPGREYDITVKAVGKGNELLEANALDTSYIRTQKYEYVSDYEEGTKVPVQTIFDILDYDVQASFGKLNTSEFDVNSGDYRMGKRSNILDYSDAGFCVLDIDPDLYNSAAMIRSNVGTGLFDGDEKVKLVYVTLQYVTWLINGFVGKPTAAKQYQIICDLNNTVGDIGYQLKHGQTRSIVSADPLVIGLTVGGKFDIYGDTEAKSDYFAFSAVNIKRKPYGLNHTGTNLFKIDAKQGRLGRILINRDTLRGIETKYTSGNEKTDKMSIESFFGDLFDIIKANTGGAVDLFLMADPDNANPNLVKFFIRNRSESQGNNKRKVLSFSPNDHITADYALASKVPKDIAAAAFGGAPSTGGDASTISKALGGDLDSTSGPSYPTAGEFDKARALVGTKSFSTEATSALQSILKSIVSDEPDTKKAARKAIPFPIELTLSLYGIDGLRFGDTITFDTSRLPKRYRDDISGFQLVFTVTRIEHVFPAGGNRRWFTNVTAVARLVDSSTVSITSTTSL